MPLCTTTMSPFARHGGGAKAFEHQIIHPEVWSAGLETHSVLVPRLLERSNDPAASRGVHGKADGRYRSHRRSQPRVHGGAPQGGRRHHHLGHFIASAMMLPMVVSLVPIALLGLTQVWKFAEGARKSF